MNTSKEIIPFRSNQSLDDFVNQEFKDEFINKFINEFEKGTQESKKETLTQFINNFSIQINVLHKKVSKLQQDVIRSEIDRKIMWDEMMKMIQHGVENNDKKEDDNDDINEDEDDYKQKKNKKQKK